MAASAPPSILVLLCGLPAAGKTTLARRFTTAGSSSTRRFEHISFDDLYDASSASKAGTLPAAFDPERWKSCQKEMARRVRGRVEQQRTAMGTADKAIAKDERQQLVLLIDDNFQYRSLRKRFFQLAADLNCGFAILYVNIPAALCRERNAARCAQGEESARVPDEVFQRMASVFEPPDSRQNPWERNTHELRPGSAMNEDAKVQGTMDNLICQAARELTERRLSLEESQRKVTQQRRDRHATHQSVLHLVDLQLRQWISTQLRDASNTRSNVNKAELASHLNQRRKDFLASLKSFADISEADAVPEQVAVALVRRFQAEVACQDRIE